MFWKWSQQTQVKESDVQEYTCTKQMIKERPEKLNIMMGQKACNNMLKMYIVPAMIYS